MHGGEMSEMLSSIEENGKPWMVSPGMVVQYIKGMWYIFIDWSPSSKGTTLHKQPYKRGLISMIRELQEDLE